MTTAGYPGTRKVVVREDDHTEMWVSDDGLKAFVKQLIRVEKGFKCEPCTDSGWAVTVYEHNYPNRWEAGA